MRAPVVVEVDPVPDEATGMLQRVEAVPMHALLLERADHALGQAVLFGAVRRDELLAQPVAPDQRRKAAAGEDLPIVRTKQERHGHAAQRAETCNQGLLQRRLRLLGLPAARQVPTQQFAAMTVDHQGHRRPTIAPRPDPAHVSGPALVGRLGHRRQQLDPRPDTK